MKKFISFVIVLSFLLAGCSRPSSEETSSASSDVSYYGEGETLRSPVIRNSSFDVPVADESSSSYSLEFTGSWDLIESEEYKEELENLFYAVYPRICARWGDGTEPSTIYLYADPSDEGVAYSSGETIGVSVSYANENPTDIGWFAHELGHSAFYFYSYLDWFEEILASYAGYRYFHNTSPSTLKYIDLSCESVQSWYYEPYGEGVPFFAYLDYKYPTTPSSPGLLDSLVAAIDSGEIELEEDPLDPDTAFNSVVSSVTGYSTIEDLRLQFLSDVESGDYSFDGFSSYRDNYLTSDIPGVPDISYVSLSLPDLSSVPSAPCVSDPVSYDNVFFVCYSSPVFRVYQ